MLLTDITSDQDVIAQSLQTSLSNSDTFKALFPGETGTALVQIGSGLLAMLLYRLDVNLLNQFMPTAFSKSAIYTLSSFLGHSPTRKKGSVVTVNCTITSPITSSTTIPKYIRFSARGYQWYTTTSYTLSPGQTSVSLTLTQGNLSTISTSSNGQPYQSIYFGSGFNCDQDSVVLYVGSTLWTSTDQSLINAQGSNSYLETTTPDGQVLILFGNGLYGNVPLGGSTITIQYADTVGPLANSTVVGDEFTLIDSVLINGSTSTYLTVDAVSSTSSVGGSSEESVEQVKFTSPRLFAANQRAVRRQDYVAYILQYGGFASASAWGEYEQAIAEGTASLSMMNRAYISALSSTTTKPVELIGTGDGSDTSFSGTLTSTSRPVIPGSVTVYAGTTPGLSNEVTFRDYDGLGILCSPDQSVNVLTGGTAGSSGDAASYAASNAFDTTTTNWWRSLTTPTDTTPVLIGYDLGVGNTATFNAIRLWAPTGGDPTERSFPLKISIYGTTSAPNFATTSGWTLLRSGVYLPDPGPSWRTDWIPFVNTTPYRAIMVAIHTYYGSSTYTQISGFEAQEGSSMGTIDYSTGAIAVEFTTPPAISVPVNVQTLSTDLTTSQQTNLLTYMQDYTHFTTQLEYRSPVAHQFNVVVDVYVELTYSSTSVQTAAAGAIQSLFTYNEGSIGGYITVSDIYRAVESVNGVDYCVVQSPRFDSPAIRNQFPYLVDAVVNAYYTSRT